MRVHLENSFKTPVTSAWAHIVVYYRYKTYQKYAIDLWEDLCGFLDKKAQSYFMAWAVSRVMNYTNLSHPCPYTENIYVKFNNVSIDAIQIEQLMPSGRYRLDINLTKKAHTFEPKNVYGSYILYGSVEDNRLDRFWLVTDNYCERYGPPFMIRLINVITFVKILR